MPREWNKYAMMKYETLEDYVQRFRLTSFFNEHAGLLSFFYLQGQALVDYIRVPVWASALDPRVQVFWIQATRTGKTIAWEFVGEVAELAGLDTEMFTSGTDSALIGSFDSIKNDDGSYEITQNEGLLAGKKCLNFDEGSILLQSNPKQFFSEVILYLQQAMNPVGSHSNTLTKHMKHGTIETESRVSFWITTFPPSGVKEYVLTKGLFQRVLLYVAPWSEDMRQRVSEQRMSGVYKDMVSGTASVQEIADYFIRLKEKTRRRVLDLANIPQAMWDDMEPDEQDACARSVMHEMFTVAPDFDVRLQSAVHEYYTLVRGMDPQLSNVVCSFIPNILNYTVLFATHLAILDTMENDGEWEINGDHVDMALELIYDIYEQLVIWLESEVEVGAKAAEKAVKRKAWKDAFGSRKTHDLGEVKGVGWVLKSDMLQAYGSKQDRSQPVVYNHYLTVGPKSGSPLFKEPKVKGVPYVRWVGDNQ